jgi:hypothetical protein
MPVHVGDSSEFGSWSMPKRHWVVVHANLGAEYLR